jgi:GTPase Era involved in 16S rRNA processing
VGSERQVSHHHNINRSSMNEFKNFFKIAPKPGDEKEGLEPLEQEALEEEPLEKKDHKAEARERSAEEIERDEMLLRIKEEILPPREACKYENTILKLCYHEKGSLFKDTCKVSLFTTSFVQ